GHYTLALNERGGVRDDLICFRLEDGYLDIMNAGNRDKILEHFRAHLPAGVVARFFVQRLKVQGVETLISRTGYTGEDGLELYPESGRAVALWQALLD